MAPTGLLTARLQLALAVLSKPLAEVRQLLAERATLPRVLAHDEVDGLEALEREEAQAEGRPPWLWARTRRLHTLEGQPEPDVEVTAEPFLVAANGALPRFFVDGSTSPDDLWLLRAVRQRARTYERVAQALVDPNQARLLAGRPLERQSPSAVAQALGLHVNTVERVRAAGLLQVEARLVPFEAFF